jgi:hypothetical protein
MRRPGTRPTRLREPAARGATRAPPGPPRRPNANRIEFPKTYNITYGIERSTYDGLIASASARAAASLLGRRHHALTCAARSSLSVRSAAPELVARAVGGGLPAGFGRLRRTRALRRRVHHIRARRLGRVTHRAVVSRGVGVRARRRCQRPCAPRRRRPRERRHRRPRRAWASESASAASSRATAVSCARRRRRVQLRRAHRRLHPCKQTRPNGRAPRGERKPLGTVTA